MSGRDDSTDDREATEWRVIEQRAYDPADGPELTTVVIEAIAAASGADVRRIKDPPLYEAVDIVAVNDALFGPFENGRRDVTGGSIDFEYRGYRITVRGDGWVQVAEQVDQ